LGEGCFDVYAIPERSGSHSESLLNLSRWKHAASCHKANTLEGEADIYIEDDIFHRVQEFYRQPESSSLQLEEASV
jgi:hypothetical protein